MFRLGFVKFWFFSLLAVAWLAFGFSLPIAAADVTRTEENKPDSKKILRSSSLEALTIFKPDFMQRSFFDGEVQDLTNEEAELRKAAAEKAKKEQETASAQVAEKNRGPLWVGEFKPEDLLPPDQTPRIRVNKEAPASFIGMAVANQNGDRELAARYADQWVRYQQNFFFEVRQLTDLIGEALIRQGEIKDDDWDGVGQYINYEFAKTMEEKGGMFKPTHDRAMERVKPDSKNEAEIYYFFTLNCSYCRYMAADVERLWQVVKNDPKIKMVALTLEPVPTDWIDEYRKYTGLTLPIFSGEKYAKALRVKFTPALAILSPNGKKAYLKTGQQNFSRMYEFARRVQGLPATLTPAIDRLMNTPIGQIEIAKLRQGNFKKGAAASAARFGQTEKVDFRNTEKRVEVEKF